MADVKELIDKVVDKAKNDPKFMDELKKDPEKAVESVIGMDIPDGMADKVLSAVKSKDTLDKVGGVLNMLKK